MGTPRHNFIDTLKEWLRNFLISENHAPKAVLGGGKYIKLAGQLIGKKHVWDEFSLEF
jgi:hypothetical protein